MTFPARSLSDLGFENNAGVGIIRSRSDQLLCRLLNARSVLLSWPVFIPLVGSTPNTTPNSQQRTS